jgi:hypothetical protein
MPKTTGVNRRLGSTWRWWLAGAFTTPLGCPAANTPRFVPKHRTGCHVEHGLRRDWNVAARACWYGVLCIHSVGQVPPGVGCWPGRSPRRWDVLPRTRLALFQSIGQDAMWNMAYGGSERCDENMLV